MAPLVTALSIVLITVSSDVSSTFNEILILFFAFIFPLLLVTFIMLYFPHKYIIRIIFDRDKNLLIKKKKEKNLQEINLDNVTLIYSKTIKTTPGCKYKLSLQETDDNSHLLFDEDTPFGAGSWDSFSEKLSKTTELPLNKENWIEDVNGKLSKISPEERVESNTN